MESDQTRVKPHVAAPRPVLDFFCSRFFVKNLRSPQVLKHRLVFDDLCALPSMSTFILGLGKRRKRRTYLSSCHKSPKQLSKPTKVQGSPQKSAHITPVFFTSVCKDLCPLISHFLSCLCLQALRSEGASATEVRKPRSRPWVQGSSMLGFGFRKFEVCGLTTRQFEVNGMEASAPPPWTILLLAPAPREQSRGCYHRTSTSRRIAFRLGKCIACDFGF